MLGFQFDLESVYTMYAIVARAFSLKALGQAHVNKIIITFIKNALLSRARMAFRLIVCKIPLLCPNQRREMHLVR